MESCDNSSVYTVEKSKIFHTKEDVVKAYKEETQAAKDEYRKSMSTPRKLIETLIREINENAYEARKVAQEMLEKFVKEGLV